MIHCSQSVVCLPFWPWVDSSCSESLGSRAFVSDEEGTTGESASLAIDASSQHFYSVLVSFPDPPPLRSSLGNAPRRSLFRSTVRETAALKVTTYKRPILNTN